jgi:hypothetical protein
VSEGFSQTLRQTQKHNPSLTQRVGIVANPATLSVKSVVKKQNHIFTTDSTENTDESQSSQNEFFVEEERSMFSHFAP